MNEGPSSHKRGHRVVMHGRREALDVDNARTAAERLRDHFLLHPLVSHLKPGPVLVPVRHGAEIDTGPLASLLVARGWTLCRPRTDATGRRMEAVPFPLDGPYVRGRHGIAGPPPGIPACPADALALVVVPGLAFDRTGHRIGYGGGFFDHFLRRAGDAVTVGVGYRFQLLPDLIESETHDVPLSGLQLEDLSLVSAPR